MKDVTTRIVVAGTSGGVGTTTVTALLFDARRSEPQGAPRLFDHSGGDLGARLAEGDDAPTLQKKLGLHDLGAHARTEGVAMLADPSVILVVVAPATPAGCSAAEAVLADISARYSSTGLSRTLVALVGTFGRHRIAARVEELHNRFGRRKIVVFAQDEFLAAGGRVPLARLTPASRRSQAELAGFVREVLSLRGTRD